MENKKKNIFKTAVILVSGIFILYGFMRGEAEVVFSKAVNICLDWIGVIEIETKIFFEKEVISNNRLWIF